MEFQFEGDEEKTALTGPDEDVYPHLERFNQAQFKKVPSAPETWSEGSAYVSEHLQRPYDVQPAQLPFTRDDLQAFRHNLQAFIDKWLEGKGDHGYWSVLWLGQGLIHGMDDIYLDGFRPVIYFRTIDFMIRPLSELKQHTRDPNRLHISAADIKDILTKALEHVDLNRDEPLKVTTGRGFMINPADDFRYTRMERIPFEWKIDRVPGRKMERRVHQWRTKQCGKYAKSYHARKEQYSRFMRAQDPETAQPVPGRSQIPGPASRRKRGSDEAGAGPQPGPSYKRHSTTGSQSSTYSRAGSSSQSAMASPETLRPPSLAELAQGGMAPPSMMSSPPMMGSPPINGPGMYSTGYAPSFSPSFGLQSATGSQAPSEASAYSPHLGLGPYPGQSQPPSLVGSPGSIISESTSQESLFSSMAVSQPGPGHGQQLPGYGDQNVYPTQMIYGLGMPPRPTFIPGAGSGQPAPHAGLAAFQYGSDYSDVQPQRRPGFPQGGENQPDMYAPSQQGIRPPGISPPMPPPGMAQQGRGTASRRMNPLEFGSSHFQSMPANPQGGGNSPYSYQHSLQGGWSSQGGDPAPGPAENYPGGTSNQPRYQGPYGRRAGSGHG